MPDEMRDDPPAPAPPPGRRFLLLGLAFALPALVIVLRWPPDPRLERVWAALMLASAGCLLLHERALRRSGRPSRLLRWVAVAIGVAELLLLAIGGPEVTPGV